MANNPKQEQQQLNGRKERLAQQKEKLAELDSQAEVRLSLVHQLEPRLAPGSLLPTYLLIPLP